MNICIVYLGPTVPNYVMENLKYLLHTFKFCNIWFISDNSTAIGKAKNLGAQTWVVRNPIYAWTALKNMEVDSQFRNGFWKYTVGRIESIRDFMAHHSKTSLLYIESDVLIAPNFPFEILTKIEKNLAFVLQGDGVGIPSTLYIRDLSSIEHLCDFFTESIIEGKYLVDMFILGDYFKKHPEKVYVLPSALPDQANFNQDVSAQLTQDILENSDAFFGIFDSSTWGQYYFGIDPRNYLGLQVYQHIQKTHAVNPSVPKAFWLKDGNIQLVYKDSSKFLYSLHIHSKDTRAFQLTPNSFIGEMLRRSLKARRRYKFYPEIFFREFSLKKFVRLSHIFLRTLKDYLTL